MTDDSLILLAAFILVLSATRAQTPVYHCEFDNGLVGDCTFTFTAGPNSFTSTDGAQTTPAIPTQPLSDVRSIRKILNNPFSLWMHQNVFSSPCAVSPTTPADEQCELPYRPSLGTWDLYFCQRFSPTNFTCPTASGTGNCNAGLFSSVWMSSDRVFSSSRIVRTRDGEHEPLRSDAVDQCDGRGERGPLSGLLLLPHA